VCCSVLQRVAARCSALQWTVVFQIAEPTFPPPSYTSTLARTLFVTDHTSAVQCVAVCCSVLQCVAVYWSVLQCVATSGSVLQCVAANACRHIYNRAIRQRALPAPLQTRQTLSGGQFIINREHLDRTGDSQQSNTKQCTQHFSPHTSTIQQSFWASFVKRIIYYSIQQHINTFLRLGPLQEPPPSHPPSCVCVCVHARAHTTGWRHHRFSAHSMYQLVVLCNPRCQRLQHICANDSQWSALHANRYIHVSMYTHIYIYVIYVYIYIFIHVYSSHPAHAAYLWQRFSKVRSPYQ